LSAGEVVDAHIALIEAVTPKLNAVVIKRYEVVNVIESDARAGNEFPQLTAL